MTTVLGGTLIVEPELNPTRAVGLIETPRCPSTFRCAADFSKRWRRHPNSPKQIMSSLQTAIVGGAAVPVELLVRWADKACYFARSTEMTDAGGVATATLRHEALGSTGLLRHRVDLHGCAVMGEDGELRGPGEQGEIVVTRPSGDPGLLGRPNVYGTGPFATAGYTAGSRSRRRVRAESLSSTA